MQQPLKCLAFYKTGQFTALQMILCSVWLTSQAEHTVLLQNIKASLTESLKLYHNVWPLRRHFYIKVANKRRGVQNESLRANYLEYIMCNTICASPTMSLEGWEGFKKFKVICEEAWMKLQLLIGREQGFSWRTCALFWSETPCSRADLNKFTASLWLLVAHLFCTTLQLSGRCRDVISHE